MNLPYLDTETCRSLFPILGERVTDKRAREATVTSVIIETDPHNPDAFRVFYRVELPDGSGRYYLQDEFKENWAIKES